MCPKPKQLKTVSKNFISSIADDSWRKIEEEFSFSAYTDPEGVYRHSYKQRWASFVKNRLQAELFSLKSDRQSCEYRELLELSVSRDLERSPGAYRDSFELRLYAVDSCLISRSVRLAEQFYFNDVSRIIRRRALNVLAVISPLERVVGLIKEDVLTATLLRLLARLSKAKRVDVCDSVLTHLKEHPRTYAKFYNVFYFGSDTLVQGVLVDKEQYFRLTPRVWRKLAWRHPVLTLQFLNRVRTEDAEKWSKLCSHVLETLMKRQNYLLLELEDVPREQRQFFFMNAMKYLDLGIDRLRYFDLHDLQIDFADNFASQKKICSQLRKENCGKVLCFFINFPGMKEGINMDFYSALKPKKRRRDVENLIRRYTCAEVSTYDGFCLKCDQSLDRVERHPKDDKKWFGMKRWAEYLKPDHRSRILNVIENVSQVAREQIALKNAITHFLITLRRNYFSANDWIKILSALSTFDNEELLSAAMFRRPKVAEWLIGDKKIKAISVDSAYIEATREEVLRIFDLVREANEEVINHRMVRASLMYQDLRSFPCPYNARSKAIEWERVWGSRVGDDYEIQKFKAHKCREIVARAEEPYPIIKGAWELTAPLLYYYWPEVDHLYKYFDEDHVKYSLDFSEEIGYRRIRKLLEGLRKYNRRLVNYESVVRARINPSWFFIWTVRRAASRFDPDILCDFFRVQRGLCSLEDQPYNETDTQTMRRRRSSGWATTLLEEMDQQPGLVHMTDKSQRYLALVFQHETVTDECNAERAPNCGGRLLVARLVCKRLPAISADFIYGLLKMLWLYTVTEREIFNRALCRLDNVKELSRLMEKADQGIPAFSKLIQTNVQNSSLLTRPLLFLNEYAR